MGFLDRFRKQETRQLSPLSFPVSSSVYRPEQNSTALSCINFIANAVAAMPLDLFMENKKATFHALYSILHDEPNSDETIDLFLHTLVRDYFSHGNIFIYIYRNEDGNIAGLFRIDPTTVNVTRDSFNRKLFKVKEKTYDYTQVLHIPNKMSYDGLVGTSIFRHAANTFELADKLYEYETYSLDNSFGKRLVIDLSEAFPNATDEQMDIIRQRFAQAYTGPKNSGKPLFKAKKINFSAIDSGVSDNRAAQFRELKELSDSEICKLFGVPVMFITGENITGDVESIYTLFVDNAVKPIATALEQGFEKLLYPAEREKLQVKFNYNAIIKTSLQAKVDAYTKQLSSGQLTVNEVRGKENLLPVDGGDNIILSGGNFFVLTDENVKAYMVNARLKAAEAEKHSPLGDDKS